MVIYKEDLWVSKQKEINEQIDKGGLLVNKQKEINENGGGGSAYSEQIKWVRFIGNTL